MVSPALRTRPIPIRVGDEEFGLKRLAVGYRLNQEGVGLGLPA